MVNKIFALIGPLGSGKSLLIKRLKEMGLHYIPVYTTKTRFPSKEQAALYKTVPRDAFFSYEYLVQVTYKGEYYGILKSDVLDAMTHQKSSLCILEKNGLKQMERVLKKKLSTIFLMKDFSNLVDTLIKMGYKKDAMRYHLEYAQNNGEFDNWKICDHVIKVSDEDTAFRQALAILDIGGPAKKK